MRSWVLLLVCITCVMGVCNDETKTRDTYVAYQIGGGGGICGGSFRIDIDKSNGLPEATALLFPDPDNSRDIIILTFYDYKDDREVLFTFPVGDKINKVNEYYYDSEFGMGIMHAVDSCTLTSGVENLIGGVSIHVKKFKASGGGFGFQSVEELEVAFNGIMTDKNHPDGAIEYTINGDLYYREQF